MAAKKGGFGGSDLALLAGAGALAWFILRGKTPAGSVKVGALQSDPVTTRQAADRVLRNTPTTQVSAWNGWQFFSDGTAIDEFGAYYLNGQKVWDPIFGAVS